jgi:hypothetical protein
MYPQLYVYDPSATPNIQLTGIYLFPLQKIIWLATNRNHLGYINLPIYLNNVTKEINKMTTKEM